MGYQELEVNKKPKATKSADRARQERDKFAKSFNQERMEQLLKWLERGKIPSIYDGVWLNKKNPPNDEKRYTPLSRHEIKYLNKEGYSVTYVYNNGKQVYRIDSKERCIII